VSGQGGPSRLAKIKVVRKSVARVLTVLNQNKRNDLKKAYRGRKYKPLDLRIKKTRALRRALTPNEAHKKTERQKKREQYFPLRKFAVKA